MTHLDPISRLDLGTATRFAQVGSRLYAFNHHGAGRLSVIDVRDPSAPAVERTLELRRPISWVGAVGDKLAVCEDSRALHIYLADTLEPWSMYPLLGREIVWGEGTATDRLTVLVEHAGLLVFDVAPRGTPTLTTILEIGRWPVDALRVGSTILVASEREGLAIVEDDGSSLRERTRLFRHDDNPPDPEPIAPRRLQRAGDTLYISGWSDRMRTCAIDAIEDARFDGDIEDVSTPRLTTEDGELIVLDDKIFTWREGERTVRFARRLAGDEDSPRYVEIALRWDPDQERIVADRPPRAARTEDVVEDEDEDEDEDVDEDESLRRPESIRFAQRVGDHLATIEDHTLVIYRLPAGSLFQTITAAPTQRD